MKKSAVVLFFLAMLIFAFTCVASAEVIGDEPDAADYTALKYDNNRDYYYAIVVRLNQIDAAVWAGNQKALALAVSELRTIIYNCARHLVEIDQYDARIDDVLAWAVTAAGMKADTPVNGLYYRDYLQMARLLAQEILFPGFGEPVVTSGSESHS